MKTPAILYSGKFTQQDLATLRAKPIWKTVDIYQQQLAELFVVRHPAKQHDEKALADFVNNHDGDNELSGCWVYYPWSGVLLHCVSEAELFELRTNRNKNLVTASEQAKLKDICVGILGLSVGRSIASTLAYSGLSANMKLADKDTLETVNLNRLRARLSEVTESKLALAAQHIWELNPFAKLKLFADGIHDKNLDDFFGAPKPTVIFDEMDDFPMKIKIRLKARERKTPVIMLTSLGDNILIDIERYDLDHSSKLFNGLIGDTPEEILRTKVGEREKIKYAIDLVGTQYIPSRALESLFEINKTLIGRPQLASTISVDGGLGAFLVRRLALDEELPSGRYYLSLGKALGLTTIDSEHDAAVARLNKLLGRS